MSHYKDLIARIEEDNSALKQLTSQSIRLETSRHDRGRAKHLNSLRNYALGIYKAVGSAFKCKCKVQHQAGLSLAREYGEQPFSLGPGGEHRFEILISGATLQSIHGSYWQQLRLEVAETQKKHIGLPVLSISETRSAKSKVRRVGFIDEVFSTGFETPFENVQSENQHIVLKTASFAVPTSTFPIVDNDQKSSTSDDSTIAEKTLDLCEILKTQTKGPFSTSFGMITDKYTKFTVHIPLDPSQRRTVSLDQVLNGKATSWSHIPFIEKLNVAAIVSSAVLELYGTPWMESEPIKQRIHFFENSRRLCTSAFVATEIEDVAQDQDTEDGDALPPYIENRTLFALGILLIELLFSAPIETMRTDKDPVSSSDKSNWEMKYSIAIRLLKNEDILIEGGPNYESAVKGCIKCNFDQFREVNLDIDECRQVVYERVVSVLENLARGLGQGR
jgi:hypothetical protein